MKKDMNTQSQFNLSQHACMKLTLACLISGAFSSALALPTGEQVTAGNASFVRDGQNMSIHQTSQQAIVNWLSFGIAANEAVKLLQPKQGSALFRVIGNNPSEIFGSLSATGSLFLVNPNGVLFAAGAQVNVGNLVATTMQISDQDFLARRYQFTAESNASVVNQGMIQAEDGGYIVLLGHTVENSGSLIANQGSVVLGSAQSALLDVYGDGLVQVKLSGDALQAVVNNTGNMIADGGAIQLATNARTAAINVDGIVQANTLENHNGVIRLQAGANGRVLVSGKLSAKGELQGTQGGFISVEGDEVGLINHAVLNASGKAGGGTVLVGGDYQGKNVNIQNANKTFVGQNATINVDATEHGNGGKTIVWADDITRYYGNISAKGGTRAGNGGFAEVSGKRLLDFNGRADLSASNGLSGNLLLDPLNITLTTADANTTGFTPPADITEAFADDASLDSTFRVNAGGSFAGIAAGSTITLQATNDIKVNSAFNVATATGSANNSLVLQANNNINVNAAVTTTGAGSITMNADADGNGAGDLVMGTNNILAQSGGITLSGANITKTTGTIISTGAAGANGGNINVSAIGAINLGAGAVTTNGGAAATAGSAGNVSITAGTGVAMTGGISAVGANSTGANTVGGNGGNVVISTTAGNISTGAINATGGNAGAGIANSSNAGNINIAATTGNVSTGALTARTGSATGTGASGVVGSINVSGADVTLAALTTSGQNNGNGGSITANATGALTLNGAINSSGGTVITGNAGKNAGAINLTGNTITTAAAATITANGSNGLGANQAGGHGAAVVLNAVGAISARAIAANGGNGVATNAAGGNAGSIMVSTNTGNITTGALTARTGAGLGTGADSTQGFITVNNTSAVGTITTAAINTSGQANGHGGNVSVTGNGNVAINGTIITSGGTSTGLRTGRNAGNVTISGLNRTITDAITANGGAGIGANQAGGNAGVVSITGAGTLRTLAVNSQTGAATGIGAGGAIGGITLNGTTVDVGALTTSGASNGNAGSVNVVSTVGNMKVGAIATNGGTAITGTTGRNAGTVTLNSAGTVTATSIVANGSAGVGVNQAGGNAGAVSIIGIGGIATTSIAAVGGNASTTNANGGNAGSIAINNSATGNIATTTLNSQAGATTGTGTGGTAGSISVINTAAAGNATTTNITTAGNANAHGGNVLLSSLGNTMVTGTMNTSGGVSTGTRAGRNAGNVTITGFNRSVTGAITVNGGAGVGTNQAGGNAGVVAINGTGTLTTAAITTSTGARTGTGAGGVAGSVTLSGSSVVATAISTAAGTGGTGGNVNVTTTGAASSSITSINANNLGALNMNIADTLTVNGVITGTNSVLTKTGAGTLILGGANTYTGATNINAGTLSATNARALGAAAGGTTVASGATLNVNNVTLTETAITINGNGVGGAGALTATNAGGVNGTVTTASNSLIGTTSAPSTLTLNGVTTAANNLGIVGLGDVTATNAANNFSTVNISGAKNVNLRDTNAITLGNGASNLTGNLTVRSGGNVTLANSVTTTGGDITLAGTNFVNNAGSGALSASGRWLVYANNHTANTFGGLDSANQAVWGTAALAAVAATGNRYVFANSPTLTVISSNQSKTYGQDGEPIVATAFNATGFINAATFGNVFTQDTVANSLTGSAISAGSSVTANAGSYVIDVTPITATNGYTLSKSNAGTLTVNKAVINLAGTRTYDGTAAFNASVFGTFSTGINGENLNLSGVGSVASANAGAAQALTTGSLGLVNGSGLASNYTLVGGTHTGLINKADITAVTGITADNKTYNGNTNATLNTSGASFTGIVAGENLSVGAATGSFNSKDVLTANTISINGITLADNGTSLASNYNLTDTTASAAANIVQRNITVTANAGQNKVIGSTDPLPFTFSVGGLGLVGGDVMSGSLVRDTGETIGTYAINQGSLDAGSNYAVTYLGSNFSILTPPPIESQINNPYSAAGLVDVNPDLSNYTNRQLFVLNVGFTAAGNTSGDGQADSSLCEENQESQPKDKDYVLMLNYGLNLPKNMRTNCI